MDWVRGRRQRVPDLGDREIAVLCCIWDGGDSTAREVQSRLAGDRVTLSTIQSTLERLTRKGLVKREKHGRAYRYSPRLSRSQLIARLIRDIADDLADGELAPMMMGFTDFVAAKDPALEALLEELLDREDKRRD